MSEQIDVKDEKTDVTSTDAEVTKPKTGDTPGQESGTKAATFTQADIDKIIADRLARAKDGWDKKAADATKKAADKAEEQRLKEQAEWQALAEKHEAELAEIKPQYEASAERLDRYTTALTSYLESARAGVPGHIISLLDNLDPVEQLNWLTEHASELGKPLAPKLDAGVGSSVDPKKVLSDEQKEQMAHSMGVDPRFLPDDIGELFE